MKILKFSEYLNTRGTMDEKPKVSLTGDEVDVPGSSANRPPKNSGEGAGENGDIPAYKTPTAAIDPNKGKNSDGLGTQGPKQLVYNPDTTVSDASKMGGKAIPTFPKSKTEAFLAATSDMDAKQFTSFMRANCCRFDESLPTITAPQAGKFHPMPFEAIRYVAALVNQNESMMNSLISQLMEEGVFNHFLEAAMDFPQTYAVLAEMFSDEDGLRRCKTLVRAMNEAVGPPITMGHDDKKMVPPAATVTSDDQPDDDDDDDDDSDDDDHSHPDDLDHDQNNGDEDDDGDEDGDGEMGPDGMPKHGNPHQNMMQALGGFPPQK